MGSFQQGGQSKQGYTSMKIDRKVHNVLPVMVYGSERWALKRAHMELLSVIMDVIKKGI